MKKGKDQPPDQAELRRRAETRLAARKAQNAPSSTEEDTRRLVHELQVHQIELEIQNEELLQARQELEMSLEHFNDLYDFAPAGYFTLNDKGVIAESNLTGGALLGVDRSVLVGHRLDVYLAPESRSILRKFLGAMSRGAEKKTCQVKLAREAAAPPQYLHLEGTAKVAGQGRHWQCRVAALDISARKHWEETAASLARERAQFVSMIAHDMKTPLVSIQGFAQLLLKKGEALPQDKRKSYQEIIARQSGRLEAMLNEFLDFLGLQNGHQSLNLAPTDMEAVLRDLVEAFLPRYQQSEVELDLASQRHMPLIQADAPRLRRAFTNLLDNALKHSPAGAHVRLELRLSEGEVMVGVRDQGSGISAEDVPHIFEPFYRGSRGQAYKGHGLGLTGVEAIVKGHGGQVSVESRLGQGSTFTVVLPFRAAQDRV